MHHIRDGKKRDSLYMTLFCGVHYWTSHKIHAMEFPGSISAKRLIAEKLNRAYGCSKNLWLGACVRKG